MTRVLRTMLAVLLSGVGLTARAQELSRPVVATAYDFSFTASDGAPRPLEPYRGQVLLVVNVASRCGFTGQYAGLEQLYEQYKDRGLVVLGVPSNDFGAQEPGSDAEIQKFASETYRATFPLTRKTVVSGAGAHPFYRWAAAQGVGGLLGAAPRWNFHKYLIGRDGRLIGSYSALTKPDNAGLKHDIEAALVE